ncbi:MAG TPA: hypothetical protein VK027_08640 [Chitinophagaceae bacterium]|nr:hypothetical protein [Chitinophagaceae bacterium]
MADTNIANIINNPSLTSMIEEMGKSIARAQKELDKNSIDLLLKMASEEKEDLITIGGNEYSLIALGFAPSFFAFTEATFEAKLEFSMTESSEFGVGGEIKVEKAMVAVSVNAHYARKYEQSAEGSSSIYAKMVSLPPPENLMNIVKSTLNK